MSICRLKLTDCHIVPSKITSHGQLTKSQIPHQIKNIKIKKLKIHKENKIQQNKLKKKKIVGYMMCNM